MLFTLAKMSVYKRWNFTIFSQLNTQRLSQESLDQYLACLYSLACIYIFYRFQSKSANENLILEKWIKKTNFSLLFAPNTCVEMVKGIFHDFFWSWKPIYLFIFFFFFFFFWDKERYIYIKIIFKIPVKLLKLWRKRFFWQVSFLLALYKQCF